MPLHTAVCRRVSHRIIYSRGKLKIPTCAMGSKTQQGQERMALIASLLS